MADKEKKYSDIDLSEYESGFQGSNALTQAGVKKQNAENAYNAFANAGFSSEKQGLADDILSQYLNRDPFSYDFNADALYQQYKDKYIQQGKMAMQDTMGQAAAMTGGYGNSYAATVGNQAYQAQLQNLNDIIPELYQLAYDKYNQEGQNMLNQYSLLGDAIDREYGMWGDKLGILKSDRDYYGNEYDNVFNRGYGMWNDQRTFDQNQYWNETNFGYGKDQDAITNALREREMKIAEAKEKREQEEWARENLPTARAQAVQSREGYTAPKPAPKTPTPTEELGAILDDIAARGDSSTAEGQRKTRQAINKEIMLAHKAGIITADQAQALRDRYNPKGLTK